MTETFYKRPLPTGLIPFASDEGRALFQRAMTDGTMAGYFALAEQFHTQAESALSIRAELRGSREQAP